MELEQRIGAHVKRAEQQLMRAKAEALEPFDLTVPQYAALLATSTTPGISSAELARQCLVTPQTMTTVLKNLTAKGLVERRPHPTIGHVQETFLTAEGKRVLRKADKAAVAIEHGMADALGATDSRRLIELLGRLSEQLGARAS